MTVSEAPPSLELEGAARSPAPCAVIADAARPAGRIHALQTLQLGMGWFGEKAGGLNRVYAHLVDELSRDGVELHGLVAGSADVARASNGRVHAFAPAEAPLRARLRALRSAARVWLREHPDAVIASHFALNAFPVLTETARHPLVVHFQGPWGQESRVEGDRALTVFAKECVERAVYRRASRLIVLSTAFRDMLAQRFRIDLERIHVIPGGVDVGRFAIAASRAECRRALRWPEGRPIVLCVRRLVRRVGVDMLVDAAAALRARVPEALVLIAGRGPLEKELEARIAARGLANHVRLLGFVADRALPMAYRAADLTVVPTTALEGFGLVTVESLAAGTPCVVTPVGGLTDVVAPFAPQLVSPTPAAADVADVLARALLGELALPSAAHCASYAREQFDWPVVAEQVRRVYEEARS